MGRSDKPEIECRFFDQVRYVEGFIRQLDLANLALVLHDWGNAPGFHYAMRHRDRIRGQAFLKGFLGPLTRDRFPGPKPEVFQKFRTPRVGWELIAEQNMFVEKVLLGSVARGLPEEAHRRYREPFLEPESRTPVWRWPNELPIEGKPAYIHEVVENCGRWLLETPLPKLLFHAQPGGSSASPWSNGAAATRAI